MFLVAGLGNPGKEYASNRHNIGFMAADEIVRRSSFSDWHTKFNADMAEGKIAGEKVLLIKPTTFMNLSGKAVGKAAGFYKIPPEKVIVFYDELDLPPGKIRVKTGGGNNGHNGLKSIDSMIGPNYVRVRVGIGRPAHKGAVTSHVLGDFTPADDKWKDPLLTALAENIDYLIKQDSSGFMNRIALQTRPPENDQKRKKKQKPPEKAVKITPHYEAGPSMEDDSPLAQALKLAIGKKDGV